MFKPFQISRKKQGISFVDILISIVLLGATIGPIFLFLSRSSAGTIQTQEEVLAYNSAEELLDFAIAQPPNSSWLVPSAQPMPVESGKLKLTTSSGEIEYSVPPKFEAFLNVSEPASPPGWPYRYLLLLAKVQWKTASGKERIVQMSAYKLR
jgi:hypothetical protein